MHAAREIGTEFVVGLRVGEPCGFLQCLSFLPEVVDIRIAFRHVHEVFRTDLLRCGHRFLRVVVPGGFQVRRFCRWFVPDIELFLQHLPGFGRGGFCHGVFRQIEGRLTVPQFLLHQHALDQRLDGVILGQPVIGLFQVLFGTDAIAVPAAEVIGCLGAAQFGGFLHVTEGFLFVFFRLVHTAGQVGSHLVMGFGVREFRRPPEVLPFVAAVIHFGKSAAGQPQVVGRQTLGHIVRPVFLVVVSGLPHGFFMLPVGFFHMHAVAYVFPGLCRLFAPDVRLFVILPVFVDLRNLFHRLDVPGFCLQGQRSQQRILGLQQTLQQGCDLICVDPGMDLRPAAICVGQLQKASRCFSSCQVMEICLVVLRYMYLQADGCQRENRPSVVPAFDLRPCMMQVQLPCPRGELRQDFVRQIPCEFHIVTSLFLSLHIISGEVRHPPIHDPPIHADGGRQASIGNNGCR